MGKSSSSQSKASEPAFTIQTLQNGGHPRVEEFTRKRGLYGNNQSHRFLSDSAKKNFFIMLNYQKDFSAPTLSGTRISGVFDKFQHPITSNSGGKLRKLCKKCQRLLEQTNITVRELSKFLAIFPLYYRHLHSQKLLLWPVKVLTKRNFL